MKLEWDWGKGPADTKELATLIRAEGRLGTRHLWRGGLRCAFGVLLGTSKNTSDGMVTPRALTSKSQIKLEQAGFHTAANDTFVGTPEERCEYMAQIAEDIPCTP